MKETDDPKRNKSAKRPWVDMSDLRALIDLVKDTEVSELEVEKGGIRVRIKKPAAPSSGLRRIQETVPAALPTSIIAHGTTQQIPEVVEDKYHLVCSPIVGTFFRAASPGAEPYVNIGDIVKKGQILCIVEAMKLMNEIESEVEGKIVEIPADDGQPVEYGEVLFKIEPIS